MPSSASVIVMETKRVELMVQCAAEDTDKERMMMVDNPEPQTNTKTDTLVKLKEIETVMNRLRDLCPHLQELGTPRVFG